ncbi:hypothetical protein PG991_009202 [Apiospora marii]|uniref:Cullin N-terminal domain-containing protein n=1 Tax=Apiospora marii TaxID=335849 RepID=A0ABR1RM40_9PEZI
MAFQSGLYLERCRKYREKAWAIINDAFALSLERVVALYHQNLLASLRNSLKTYLQKRRRGGGCDMRFNRCIWYVNEHVDEFIHGRSMEGGGVEISAHCASVFPMNTFNAIYARIAEGNSNLEASTAGAGIAASLELLMSVIHGVPPQRT